MPAKSTVSQSALNDLRSAVLNTGAGVNDAASDPSRLAVFVDAFRQRLNTTVSMSDRTVVPPIGTVRRELVVAAHQPMARLLAIADTDAEAEAVARAGAEWTVGGYASGKQGGPPSPLSPEERVERYVNEVIIHGSPDKVVDELQRLEATIGLDYLLASPLSHKTFLQLTDKVMPRLL